MKLFILLSLLLSCSGANSKQKKNTEKMNATKNLQQNIETSLDTATFGSGCFWCTEAVFQRLKGVEKVYSGYGGGDVDNPTYQDVLTGTSGHTEVAQILYDPKLVSYKELLEVFWKTHDPTTLNRQGNDVGYQYRSVIYYHNAKQEEEANKYKKILTDEHIFKNPIVTAIEPYKNFYAAENYHQNYFNNNSYQPYCRYVIVPKLEKFKKIFKDKLKEE